MAIDTGSDVIWLQCRPCVSCYPQSDPIFNPAASATYKPLACSSRQCAALDVATCFRGSCLYEVSYGDGSYTIGNFATETISFGSSGSVAGVAIGCGHDNEGLFSGSAGLLGLGGGLLSLPSQIQATSFSYCLVNRDSSSSSTLEFNSTEPADSVVAPMLTNSRMDTFYYVGLTGISVGGRALNVRPRQFAIGRRGSGGVIVDSGTTVTRFPTAVYSELRDAFRSMSRNLRFAGGFSLMDTCYDLSSVSRARVPTMSFQFAGGKTLPLQPRNYLIPVDNRGRHCFAFAATTGSMSIIGNVQQEGTRVSYNLAKKYIAFSPNKC
ncbi:Eukaryotic aspartyl protease family protein [Perilla frutescens var. hirtella]|nr:Eukaryotic aspartyl protease family protein [Perilla frutescens var. hirtella]